MNSVQPFVSVVIPCYNEARNLESGVLDEVYAYLRQRSYAWELLVCNDESTDNSRALVEQFMAGKVECTLVDIPHGGKPAAVWAGVQQARGEVVLTTDMDQSTPIEALGALLPWYTQDFPVVIGSRGGGREGFSPVRKLGSFVFRTVRQWFILPHVVDTQCGFKLCQRQAALETFPRLQFFQQKDAPSGWRVSAYDVEWLFLLEQAGYRIKEVEVPWRNRDRSDTKGQSGELARYLRESVDMFKEVARVKRNQMQGVYDEVRAENGT